MLIAYQYLAVGLGLHAALLCALPTHYALRTSGLRSAAGQIDMRLWDGLATLALVPLLRILSAALPSMNADLLDRTILSAILLLMAIAMAKRLRQIQWAELGLHGHGMPAQVRFGLSGALLGLTGAAVLSINSVTAPLPTQTLLAVLAIAVMAPVAEELLFRGLIQNLLHPKRPVFALFEANLLFTATYLGADSPALTLFVAAAGLYFGWWVRRTGSVVGVAIAHSLMSLGMFFVWPAFLS